MLLGIPVRIIFDSVTQIIMLGYQFTEYQELFILTEQHMCNIQDKIPL